MTELDAAASADGASEELHSFLAAALPRRLQDDDLSVVLAVLKTESLLRLPAAALCSALEDLLARLSALAAAAEPGKSRKAILGVIKQVYFASLIPQVIVHQPLNIFGLISRRLYGNGSYSDF